MTGPNRIKKDTHAPARKPSKARKVLEFTKMFGRQAAIVIGTSVVIGAATLIGGKAIAQEPAKPPVMAAATQAPTSGAGYQPDVKKTATDLTAQVNFNPPKDLIDLNRLETSSLKEMQEFEAKSQEFRKTAAKNISERTFFYGMGVPVPGQNWTIETTVWIGYDARTKTDRNDMIVTFVRKNGKREGVKYDLKKLAEMYELATGKAMKTVELIAEIFLDEKTGQLDYISIHAIPNGELNQGIPYLGVSYFDDTLHSGMRKLE
ncbi:MAG: hypothetical protein V1492_05435 [Candidatus Micrarchaeota archaeon]